MKTIWLREEYVLLNAEAYHMTLADLSFLIRRTFLERRSGHPGLNG